MADHRIRFTDSPVPEGKPVYVTFEDGVFILRDSEDNEIANATHFRLLSNHALEKGASEVHFEEDLSQAHWDLP